ncbi:MAG: hypothetical protein ABI927_00290 [Gaiellaceae bacterium]
MLGGRPGDVVAMAREMLQTLDDLVEWSQIHDDVEGIVERVPMKRP